MFRQKHRTPQNNAKGEQDALFSCDDFHAILEEILQERQVIIMKKVVKGALSLLLSLGLVFGVATTAAANRTNVIGGVPIFAPVEVDIPSYPCM